MKILPIITNHIYRTKSVLLYRNTDSKSENCSDLEFMPVFYPISFNAKKTKPAQLKKLAEYGLPDMYTGKMMLSNKALSKMLDKGVFDLPLSKLIPILNKYEDTLYDTELEVFKILSKMSKTSPNIKIDEALKQLYPEHLQKLITVQRSILYDIILKASKMPKDYFEDIMDLIRYSNPKLEKGESIAHFSEKEFIYRLQQIGKQINVKRRYNEVIAINKLIREAKKIFASQIEEKKKFGRGIKAKKLKMKYQMQPEVFTRNTQNMKYLRNLLEQTPLKNNKDILNLFNITDAKVCGAPAAEPFKRQEFIYDLKNIVKSLKDKKLEAEIIARAHNLPTSTDSISAFIVKYVNDTPENIGYHLFEYSLCSIEHLDPRISQKAEKAKVKSKKGCKKGSKKGSKPRNNIAGKNSVKNYGLSAAHVNRGRSNMPFDQWIKKYPEAYMNCQKFINRLIELYNKGIFNKLGIKKEYILDFRDTVRRLSPPEKPLILDISMLKD